MGGGGFCYNQGMNFIEEFKKLLKSKKEIDNHVVKIDCQNCDFCAGCEGSSGLIFCYDLKNCKNCFGCVGLEGEKYYLLNRAYTSGAWAKEMRKITAELKAQKLYYNWLIAMLGSE